MESATVAALLKVAVMMETFIFYFDAQTYEARSTRAMHWMLIIETGFLHGVVICQLLNR